MKPAAMPYFLLGAGASKDAGLPLAREITGQAVDRLNDPGRRPTPYGRLFNFVVAAMVAHAARDGARPDDLPPIESVVAAVDLLAQRQDLELSPFVQSWDPGLRTYGHGLHFGPGPARNLRKALLAESPGRDGAIQSAFNDLFDARHGVESDAPFSELRRMLVVSLSEQLALADDADVTYLNPLIALIAHEQRPHLATLNYDLVIETAVQNTGRTLSTGVATWQDSGLISFESHGIPLLKLHGSLNWTTVTARQAGSGLKEDRLEMRAPDTPEELPAVVYGARNKLRGEGPFLDLRTEFEKSLAETDCLVCIGYSFADDHVNEVLRRWLTRNENRWLVQVEPFPEPTRNRFRPSFRDELQHLNSPPTSPGGSNSVTPRLYRVEETAGQAMELVSRDTASLRQALNERNAEVGPT